MKLLSALLITAGSLSAQQYLISTVAGGSPPPTPAAASSASVGSPSGVATDAAGDVYFASLNCVFKVDPAGTLTRIAGNGLAGYSGDGTLAINAQLHNASNYLGNTSGLAVDSAGNVYIADFGNARIRRVSASGIITTMAGNGRQGFLGDGGPAVAAGLNNPQGIALDSAGNLYIADTDNSRIRKVSPAGIITSIAGNGLQGGTGDNALATNAELFQPNGVAVDQAGNIYIADTGNSRIRKVTISTGVMTTVAGGGITYPGDGLTATSTQLDSPYAVSVDNGGSIYIADTGHSRIARVTSGVIVTLLAQLNAPYGVSAQPSGNFYVAESGASHILKVTPSNVASVIAGDGIQSFSGDGGPATRAQLGYISATAADSAGNVYLADFDNSRVWKVSTAGNINVIAGPGTAISVSNPQGIAVDRAGTLYIADTGNRRILKYPTGAPVTTVAGNLDSPSAITVDAAANIYFIDTFNSAIKKISPDGTLTTIAGGPSASSPINPFGVAADSIGDVFFTDYSGSTVQKISPLGVITVVAGAGFPGYSGDDGLAINATLNNPWGIAVDASGNLYIVDSGNFRIRKISPGGIISTIAGTGTAVHNGDGGPASSASLDNPRQIAVDGSGDLFAAGLDNAVRELRPTNQSVLIAAVVDGASETAVPVSPGKIVVIYGAGMGPSSLVLNAPGAAGFGTSVAGTTVSFNGIPAPMIYSSAKQVAAIVPYGISGSQTAQMTVSYRSQISSALSVPVAASSPNIFSLNQSGAGQAAAIRVDGTANDAAHPVAVGSYVSLFVTGEGQTGPAGVDGKLATVPYPQPLLPVTVTVGGVSAPVTYAGGAPGEVAGVMQVNIQIPAGVQPGGYVPVVVHVGNITTVDGALWLAVESN